MFIKERFNNYYNNTTIMGTVYVSCGTMLAAMFAYLLQFYLGRALSIPQFGTFQALLSLLSVVTVPQSIITPVLVKIASELKAEERYDVMTKLFIKLMVFETGVAAGYLLILALFSRPVADYFKVSDPTLITLVAWNAGISGLLLVPMAYLNGLLRYKAFALVTFLGGVFRLGMPVVFLALGFELRGVFLGLLANGCIVLLSSVLVLKKNFMPFSGLDISYIYKRFIQFGPSFFMVSLLILLYNNVDILLIKKMFPEYDVGVFSGAFTLCKIILFGTGFVAPVMFPQIVNLKAKNENYLKRFKTFFLFELLLVLVAGLVYQIYPEFLLQLFFGRKFIASAIYVRQYAIFTCLYTFVQFFITYFLAIDVKYIWWLLLVFLLVQVGGIYYLATTISGVIYVGIITMLGLLISLIGVFIRRLPDVNRLNG